MITAAMLAVVLPATAHADWTRPHVLQPNCGKRALQCAIEPAPRADVNARGRTVVTWVDSRQRIRAAIGGPRGRFGRAASFGKGFRPGASIAADGRVVVVWSTSGELRYARTTARGRFTPPRRLVARTSRAGDDHPEVVGQPDGSTLVVYENSFRDSAGRFRTRMRSLVITRAGRVSRVLEIGRGAIHRDGFRAAANGQAAFCCLETPNAAQPPFYTTPLRSTVASWAPGRAWSSVAAPLAQNVDVQTVGPNRGAVAVGVTAATRGGESVTLGVPGLVRIGVGNALSPARPVPVVRATRAFGPVVTIDGSSRDVVVYQEKTRSRAFSRNAPIYAVAADAGAAFGARQRLDAADAYQPHVRPYRSGAIVAWQSGDRWGVSIERDGRFRRAPAPVGPGPSGVGEDFHFNRDLATRARYAVLAWTARDASVRISIGRL